MIAGKRLVVVDDSVVRGNTQAALVKMLRESGAAEVHVRISSPPVRWPCFYGIDFATRDELIATGRGVEEIRELSGRIRSRTSPSTASSAAPTSPTETCARRASPARTRWSCPTRASAARRCSRPGASVPPKTRSRWPTQLRSCRIRSAHSRRDRLQVRRRRHRRGRAGGRAPEEPGVTCPSA